MCQYTFCPCPLLYVSEFLCLGEKSKHTDRSEKVVVVASLSLQRSGNTLSHTSQCCPLATYRQGEMTTGSCLSLHAGWISVLSDRTEAKSGKCGACSNDTGWLQAEISVQNHNQEMCKNQMVSCTLEYGILMGFEINLSWVNLEICPRRLISGF